MIMKQKMVLACVLALSLAALAGCGSSKTEDVQVSTDTESKQTASVDEEEPSSADADTADSSQAAETQSNQILPTGNVIDLDHLENGTLAVSLAEGNAFIDESGSKELSVTVYTYDTYDAAAISSLKVGDVIHIFGQDAEIVSLESDTYGAVLINGGDDNGGVTLISNGENGYYPVEESDAIRYYEVGTAAIPVSDEDFLFEDSSDPSAGTVTYSFEDLISDDSGIIYNFSPLNTSITMKDGCAVRMERVYIP